IVGEGESLLVDTLWDLRLTRRMLAAMAAHTANAPVTRLVNTHADGDHCWGNQLLEGVSVFATEAAAQDMMREDPGRLRLFSRAGAGLAGFKSRELPPSLSRGATSISRLAERVDLGSVLGARGLAGLGAFARLLAVYDFQGITLSPPTETFTGEMGLE